LSAHCDAHSVQLGRGIARIRNEVQCDIYLPLGQLF